MRVWCDSAANGWLCYPSAPIAALLTDNSQLSIAGAASSGVVTQKHLEARTVYRPGELLEATPGLIVSQHSGEGKANQFYLRGINLDTAPTCAPRSMACWSINEPMRTARAEPT